MTLTQVWIILIASIAACIGFIQLMAVLVQNYFAQRMNGEYPRGLCGLSGISLYIFATLTNHGNKKTIRLCIPIRPQLFKCMFVLKGGYFRSSHRFIGMIVAVWCFATFVFVNIYSSCLTSYVSLQSFRGRRSTHFRSLQ